MGDDIDKVLDLKDKLLLLRRRFQYRIITILVLAGAISMMYYAFSPWENCVRKYTDDTTEIEKIFGCSKMELGW